MVSSNNSHQTAGISRRTALISACAAIGITWGITRWFRTHGPTDADTSLLAFAKRVVRVMGLESTATDRLNVDDAPISTMVGGLLGEQAHDWRHVAILSDAELRKRLRHNIVADYEMGRVRMTHGWLLSLTESRALNLADSLRALVK